mmetsp:Transcript_66924/g.169002  ORF Transcript_66924/g.169002 Transcript_66924/m.169002 type:complete len:217 (+) Transcript_66924:1312-1962(+)
MPPLLRQDRASTSESMWLYSSAVSPSGMLLSASLAPSSSSLSLLSSQGIFAVICGVGSGSGPACTTHLRRSGLSHSRPCNKGLAGGRGGGSSGRNICRCNWPRDTSISAVAWLHGEEPPEEVEDGKLSCCSHIASTSAMWLHALQGASAPSLGVSVATSSGKHSFHNGDGSTSGCRTSSRSSSGCEGSSGSGSQVLSVLVSIDMLESTDVSSSSFW